MQTHNHLETHYLYNKLAFLLPATVEYRIYFQTLQRATGSVFHLLIFFTFNTLVVFLYFSVCTLYFVWARP